MRKYDPRRFKPLYTPLEQAIAAYVKDHRENVQAADIQRAVCPSAQRKLIMVKICQMRRKGFKNIETVGAGYHRSYRWKD